MYILFIILSIYYSLLGVLVFFRATYSTKVVLCLHIPKKILNEFKN